MVTGVEVFFFGTKGVVVEGRSALGPRHAEEIGQSLKSAPLPRQKSGKIKSQDNFAKTLLNVIKRQRR